jgi:hypothetical protein
MRSLRQSAIEQRRAASVFFQHALDVGEKCRIVTAGGYEERVLFRRRQAGGVVE